MHALSLATFAILLCAAAAAPASAAPGAGSKSYPGYLCQTFNTTQPFVKTANGAISNPSAEDLAQSYACIAVHENAAARTRTKARATVVVVDHHPDSGVGHQVSCYLRSFRADGVEFASPVQAVSPSGGSPDPVTLDFGGLAIAVPAGGTIRIDCNIPPDAGALGGGLSGIVSYTVEEF